jgi:hypothetical protein
MDLVNPAAHAAALWASLNLFVLLVLSGLVVRQRRRHRVALGDAGVPELVRAQRAFGNAAEYIPAGLAALAVLVVTGGGAPEVHVIGALLFAGRVAHGMGLSITGGPSIGRTVGMLLTWLAWLIAAVCLLLYAL